MRRRDLLTALSTAGAFAVAGCLAGRSSGSGEPTPPDTAAGRSDTPDRGADTATPRSTTDRGGGTPTPIPDPDSQFPRHLTVASVEDRPLRERLGVAAAVEAVDPAVRAGDTARVAVRLRTTDDDPRELTYPQDECSRDDFRASADASEADLLLLPAGPDYGEDRTGPSGGACPVASSANLECGIPVVDQTVVVPPVGALTWEYDLWVPPSNLDRGHCVAPGSYRFTRTFSDADDASATLAFELAVNAP